MSGYSELMQRILVLEQQLASSSNNDDGISMAGKLAGAEVKADLGVIFENGIKDNADQQQILPLSCERTWSDFMNKHTSDSHEYALEILPEEPDYYHRKKILASLERKHGKSRGAVAAANTKTDPKPSPSSSRQRPIPNRIRINSTSILKTLKTFDEHIDATASLVMLRPFKFLVHYERQIRDAVQLLEQESIERESNTSLAVSEHSTSYQLSPNVHGIAISPEEKEIRQENLQHMRCLVDFIDRYIKPTISRLEDISYGKIHFLDLWYLFKPGDDINMPLKVQDTSIAVDAVASTPETFNSRYNQLWRVTGTSGGRPNISVAQSRNMSLRSNPFRVDCYYIDFHGRYFRPTVHTFEIMPFKGEIDITSLDFYPTRYLGVTQQQEMLQGHLERGKSTFEAMAHSFTHFFYSGPTLMKHPCGCRMQDGPTIQEHIESEVIVDFKMALRKHPSWQPEREPWKDTVIERRELQETFPVQYWNDRGRTKLESTEYDQVYNDYFIDRERAIIFKNNEQIFAPIPSGWIDNKSMLPDKDIKLLPSRVFAFVLRTRTFAPLWLWGLQAIKAKTEGLDNLQLKDNTFKDTLQALVKTHFLQKQSQNSPDFEYDIVRGKGKGLVILLHGAPGVGKTFTAESVAAANGQPLLQITCGKDTYQRKVEKSDPHKGDLGLKPKEVDTALKETFHYAQHWKCVLLLDECDIFLTQRNKTDVKRNALVSVFLRVLEFYTGVLFLTTNRVGALDEAIKSRITWVSYYPPLNWEQTKRIWQTNIKRVEKGNKNLEVHRKSIMKFAERHFHASMAESAVWNGRRIQNAFKVAAALAHWEAYSKEEQGQTQQLAAADEEDDRRSTLSAKQFKMYAAGTQAFDTYLKEATGLNDADRSWQAMERADDFEPEDDISPFSPGYERNISSSTLPAPDFRRTSSASLAPPPAQGRAFSPNLRPQLPARQSTSQLLEHQRSTTFSRQTVAGTSPQTTEPRRRSSQLNPLSPSSLPALRRQASNEHRGSIDHDFSRQSHAEYDDTALESEETYSLNDTEPEDEEYSESDD
ncbi:hypothetical protein H2200_000421 [Cladophialophora chaetospira]|uniref:AAA+ ATPase domain-containing protein n=1 Tax=Cladophialophora chaetospira TaxID=386627 RepID=A0AA38XNI0_9EURO|nr:hypothetical protein H2200_000421 [Cladophialophora chaetospira]